MSLFWPVLSKNIFFKFWIATLGICHDEAVSNREICFIKAMLLFCEHGHFEKKLCFLPPPNTIRVDKWGHIQGQGQWAPPPPPKRKKWTMPGHLNTGLCRGNPGLCKKWKWWKGGKCGKRGGKGNRKQSSLTKFIFRPWRGGWSHGRPRLQVHSCCTRMDRISSNFYRYYPAAGYPDHVIYPQNRTHGSYLFNKE